MNSAKNQKDDTQKDPEAFELQDILKLYNDGDLRQAFSLSNSLSKKHPCSAIIFNILGVILKGLLEYDNALEAYRKATYLQPEYADAWNNMGNTFHAKGELDEAIKSYSEAINIKPDFAQAHYNLANSLFDSEKQNEAIAAYERAITLNPNYPEAYFNLGNALLSIGKLPQAIDAYIKTLARKPDYAEAHNNLGLALNKHGKPDQAIKSFEKALSFNPAFSVAYNNKGLALSSLGKPAEAIEAYTKALRLKPEYTEAKYNMANSLINFRFASANAEVGKIILSILNERTVARPKDLAKCALSLLKSDQAFANIFFSKPITLTNQSLAETISKLSECELFLKLMSTTTIPNPDIEWALIKIRSHLLEHIVKQQAEPNFLNFQTALALHCFTNDFVFAISSEDRRALKTLEHRVSSTFTNGGQPNANAILCLASFRSLHSYEWSQKLETIPEIHTVIKRQVHEPEKEEITKSKIPILREINDPISRKVKEQYERNPYPKWVNTGLSFKSVRIDELAQNLRLKIDLNKIIDNTGDGRTKILVAGCGTGQHAIGTASRFRNSDVLAIDLSLSSIAYATRKTHELGIKNLQYMQADIKDLFLLKEEFDIIESVGVLHHMDDPLSGWKSLVKCLRSGGLMKVGLYSEMARENVVLIRGEIDTLGIKNDAEEIREFRTQIMKSQMHHHKGIQNSSDFYSMNTVTDLLFHVKEHRFNLTEIAEYLELLGLKFCGFEGDQIVSNFSKSYPDHEAIYDLKAWSLYENKHPKTFSGMYQFWCQKL